MYPRRKRFSRGLSSYNADLKPENEFALILSWLGRCRLVHKLGQEQLPLNSIHAFRVPDFFAAFEYEEKVIPVLVEVKTSDLDTLSLNGKYLAYAELLGLPMLVAWKHASFWTLFDMRCARLAEVNYKIEFGTAMKENLLCKLCGDFAYRPAKGTRLRMRIRKLTEPDPISGGFKGEVVDVQCVNPVGEIIPNPHHLSSLFMFWDNEVELVDEGDDVVTSFILQDVGHSEFASRTLSQIVNAFAELRGSHVNWRSIIHDAGHLAHDSGGLRALIEQGASYGVITNKWNFLPHTMPSFF